MRLLQVIPYYYPATSFGGPLTVCQALSEEMVRRGHVVSVLTTDVASRTQRCGALNDCLNGVAITRVRNWSQTLVGRANAYLPMAIGKAVDAELRKSDCVHVHEFFNWVTFAVVIRAHRQGVPILLSGHGGLSIDPVRGKSVIKRVLFHLFGKDCIEHVSAVQAATRAEAEICRTLGVAAGKTHIIPNGVPFPPPPGDAVRFRQAHGLGERPVVLFVGRLQTLKGIDLIVDAAPAVPGVCFVLVGPAENRPDFMTQGWRSPNVYVAGSLESQVLADAYAAASIFILPSYAEGLPMTALEALSYGVPAVLSNRCNLPEVAAAGAGIEIEPTSEALVHGIQAILKRRDQWASIRNAAQALVEAQFQLCKVHDQYERLYRKLIDAAGAAHN